MTFVKNMKETFGKDAVVAVEADRGDLVQTVLITAGFAVAAILVIAWISSTVAAKGSQISDCVGGAGNFASANASADACADNEKGKTAADKNAEAYGERFN